MSSVLESASTVSAPNAATSVPGVVMVPFSRNGNRPRGNVAHGLEHLEAIINDFFRSVDVWGASDEELEALRAHIAKVTTPEARIFYKYEISTRLLHIFLGPNDNNFIPSPYEEQLRSVFIDLQDVNDPRVLTSQFDQIIYNDNARRWLADNNIPWEQVEVQESIDATLILRFQHDGVDFNSTRRCMDAAQSVWNRKRSHLTLLEEVTAGQLNDLDPDLVYSLALVHPDNENIVPVSQKYAHGTAVLVDVRRKYTMERVPFTKKDMPNITLPRVKTRKVLSWNALIEMLREMDERIAETGKLESEGFILRVYWDKERTVLRKILKMQTCVYQDLKRMRPNTGSRNEMILELFLRGNLTRYMQWANIDKFTKQWVYTAYNKFLEEVHSCYHLTRGKKNPAIYNSLTGSWRSCLFELHGLYLGKRASNSGDNGDDSTYITIPVVDNHLRGKDIKTISHMVADRIGIVQCLRNRMYKREVKNTHPFYRCHEIEEMSHEFRKEYEDNRQARGGNQGNRIMFNPKDDDDIVDDAAVESVTKDQ